MDNWGLALSGGGARGIIHIGVLQAFDEAGVKPACISGASMGAIVGALYAAGVKPEEMLKLLKKKNWMSMFRIKPSFSGFLELAYLRTILEKHVPDNFGSLHIPFYVGATNLTKHTYEVFNSGSLHLSVLASASIPILFVPILIGEDRYVDAGVMNNVPSAALIGKCDKILGVDVNNVTFNKQSDNMKTIATEVFHIIVHHNSAEGLAHCDAVINPFLGSEYDMLDFSKTDALFKIGYTEATAWLKEGLS